MNKKYLIATIIGATSLVNKGVPGAVSTEFLNIITDTSRVSAENLQEILSKSVKGEYADCDLLDGREHSYVEIGDWLGSQELALRLMAMGDTLGLWTILTPSMVIPQAPEEMRQLMACRGLVTIQSRPPIGVLPLAGVD